MYMTPMIHCIRHGQGFHNLGAGSYHLPDPRLTQLGRGQCIDLRDTSFPDQSNISLIIASPLCRTLETALLVFDSAITSKGKCHNQVLALPDVQETSDDPCDIGSEASLLRRIVAENGWSVDLSLVKDGWNVKSLHDRYSPCSSAIETRARDARVFLRQKIRELIRRGDRDPQVVLVTHGSYLHYFTNDWEDSYLYPATGWSNCEKRSYTFANDLMSDIDEDASLTETEESRQKRGKTIPASSEEKQQELFKIAMECWEKQGLQRPDKLGTTPAHGSH